LFKPVNPKYLEWYSPYLDLEHTIQVCIGVKGLTLRILKKKKLASNCIIKNIDRQDYKIV